jgi:hypothetical protein
MFKRFINVRYVLVICSLAVFVAFPAQTSKADAAPCAQAVAEAAQALAEMQAACSSNPQGGACVMATITACETAAAAAEACPVN